MSIFKIYDDTGWTGEVNAEPEGDNQWFYWFNDLPEHLRVVGKLFHTRTGTNLMVFAACCSEESGDTHTREDGAVLCQLRVMGDIKVLQMLKLKEV